MVKMILTLCYFCACRFTEMAGVVVEIADVWFIFHGQCSQKSSLLQKFQQQRNPFLFSFWQPNSSNDDLQAITSGDWDVTKILAYDEKRQKMWVNFGLTYQTSFVQPWALGQLQKCCECTETCEHEEVRIRKQEKLSPFWLNLWHHYTYLMLFWLICTVHISLSVTIK